MKILKISTFGLLLTALFLISISYSDDISWNFENSLQLWKGSNCKIEILDSGVKIFPQKGLSYFYSPSLFVVSENYPLFSIKVRSSQGGELFVLWTTSYDPKADQRKSIKIPLNASNRFKEYIVNMEHLNRNWVGIVNSIAIVPYNLDSVEVKEIKLSEPNLVLNFRAGISEFFGPKGREAMGVTINVISASHLFGRPIHYYFYWAAFIFFAFSLLYFYFKTQSFLETWKESAKLTMIFIFCLWFFLSINGIYNDLLNLSKDFKQYGFKSMAEKQGLSAGEELYDYIKFCKVKIAANSRIALYHDDRLGPIVIKGRYYFYPLKIYKKTGPNREHDYLLCYYPPDDKYLESSDYQVFASMTKDKYILKRLKE
jgi:hypothetical protein